MTRRARYEYVPLVEPNTVTIIDAYVGESQLEHPETFWHYVKTWLGECERSSTARETSTG
jgi:hypothetical protein